MRSDKATAFDALVSHSSAIRDFHKLDRDACQTQWTKGFKRPPPRYLSLTFMRKALAYEAQLNNAGNHSSRVRNALKIARQKAEAVNPTSENPMNIIRSCGTTNQGTIGAKPQSASSLRAGTHLVREWNGRTHHIEVLGDGFRFDGKDYRSLSAVAKRITGAHWSGPRFFGLSS